MNSAAFFIDMLTDILLSVVMLIVIMHNSTQHNDIQQNNNQHNTTQHSRFNCDTKHNDSLLYYAQGCILYWNAYSHFVECHYSECRYAECCGAIFS